MDIGLAMVCESAFTSPKRVQNLFRDAPLPLAREGQLVGISAGGPTTSFSTTRCASLALDLRHSF
jgi:hypothetical protein